jgi:two-component system, OmpR family, sensor histidine kinase ChvG
VRLLAVNLVVVLVPLFGLELARVYERQLLHALERDMVNQASLVRVMLETGLERGEALYGPNTEPLLERAAKLTRTRIRLVSRAEGVVADSHRNGPPEGKEQLAPLLVRDRTFNMTELDSEPRAAQEAPVPQRTELLAAFKGSRATATRYARRPPAVYLFLAEPVRLAGKVVAAVYVTRSTQPVLMEMHRVRRGLFGIVTISLSFTISRPLEQLARAARRISAGETGVTVPLGGGGEIGELAQEFDQMTRRLEQRQRYISEFAADVAHELKSPLTSIRGAAELLAEGADDDPEARRRFLDNIKLDTERLTRLVSRLLELSRIDASEQPLQAVDLRQVVARAAARSEGPTTPVVVSYTASVTFILARASDLETALLNLLDNAQRFSPEGQAVALNVSGPTDDDCVLIQVLDRGPGISPEHAARVFDRFFTTDAERDGTGLGLAIVKSVATAHRGHVTFQSAPGRGTCFELRLPCDTLRKY